MACITGASSGFGLLMALELAKAGYRVIATMRDTANNGLLLRRAEEAGVAERIDCLPLDVTDHPACEETIAHIRSAYGRIDVLVNNAGMAIGGSIEEIPMEEWKRQMDVNVFGLIAMTRAALPVMREQRRGTIINIGSVSGRVGFPGYGPYAASKFAVEGFSESLRLEMLPFGVHVVLVEPGAYRTDIWSKGFDHMTARFREDSPYARFLGAVLRYSRNVARTAGEPQDVARAVVRIAGSRYPRLRYPLGRGAALSIAGKTLLPWKWFERLLLRELEKGD
ncbi:SDR family oxidoreductase [Paenibacillus doosanensis]|uniref:SDR family oxidoreductase n=1 Tax=Paenibacillus doosanensis TaxID=1229154 RepID=UPI0021801B17|nr:MULTISPECIES: SDR family oxidoreductase [Paenibacillus]MCS7460958.1 SDR family oxidoreductase [Paenibacillus doosanensis]